VRSQIQRGIRLAIEMQIILSSNEAHCFRFKEW